MSAVRSRILSSSNNTMIRQVRMGGKRSMIRIRSFGTSTGNGAKAVDPEEYSPNGRSSHIKNSDIGVESTSRKGGPVKVYSSLSAWSSSPSSSSDDDDGCIDYARSWAWQQTLLSRRMALRRRQADADNTVQCETNGPPEYAVPLLGDHDSILILEHKPVYTLGRGADENHLLFLQEEHGGIASCQDMRDRLSRKGAFQGANSTTTGSARLVMDRRFDQNSILERPMGDVVNELCRIATPVMAPNGVPIYRVDRGGEVTFHGPNQLVCYPLLDLRQAPFRQDLHWYLRMVEEVVIQTLQHYDIESKRDDVNTGVWVRENKIAAIGVSASRWITTHGFALNISPDLSYFDTSVILPCGIEGRGVTSMEKELKRRHGAFAQIPLVDDVAQVVLDVMERIFGIPLEKGDYLR